MGKTYLYMVLNELHEKEQDQSVKKPAANLQTIENLIQNTYQYQKDDYKGIKMQINQSLGKNCHGQTLLFHKWEMAQEILRIHRELMTSPTGKPPKWISIIKAIHGTFLMMEILESQLHCQKQFQEVITGLLQIQLREQLHVQSMRTKNQRGIAQLERILRQIQMRNIEKNWKKGSQNR